MLLKISCRSTVLILLEISSILRNKRSTRYVLYSFETVIINPKSYVCMEFVKYIRGIADIDWIGGENVKELH